MLFLEKVIGAPMVLCLLFVNLNMRRLTDGFVISVDFELFWGSTDTMVISEDQVLKYRRTREAIPQLLRLFEKYHVSCSWATVGFLFANGVEEILTSYNFDEPQYNDQSLSTYERLRIVDREYSDCYFAPEIIELINNTALQELSTHTFSHYYAIDDGYSAERFKSEIEKAQHFAFKAYGKKLKSIVFPRNQVCHTSELYDLGLESYRGNPAGWAYAAGGTEMGRNRFKRIYRLVDRYLNLSGKSSYKISHVQSNVKSINVPASRFLPSINERISYFEDLRLKRIKNEMLKAAMSSETYHLWWHPHNMSSSTESYLNFLEEILKYYKLLAVEYSWPSLTMSDAAGVKN